MNTTKLVLEIRPEKNSGPCGIWTHDLCDAGAALYQQLSQQANWKLVIMLDLLYSFLHHSAHIWFYVTLPNLDSALIYMTLLQYKKKSNTNH